MNGANNFMTYPHGYVGLRYFVCQRIRKIAYFTERFNIGLPLFKAKEFVGRGGPENTKREQSDGFRTVTQTLNNTVFILMVKDNKFDLS